MLRKSFAPLLLFAIIITQGALCQINIHGSPFIRNYLPIAYQSHPRNFGILQNRDGMIYAANAYGVLEFDGVAWHRVNLPDGKSAVSFAMDENGKVFVGSVDDVGELKIKPSGQTVYDSWRTRLPNDKRSFGDVWKTFARNGQQIFCSFNQITVVSDTTLRFYHPQNTGMTFDFFTEVDGEIIVRESGRGLMKLSNEGMKPLNYGDDFANRVVYAVFSDHNHVWHVISEEGLSILDENGNKVIANDASNFIKSNGITDVLLLPGNYLAISTVSNGIALFDTNGALVRQLNRKRGLANDYVYDIFFDRENNLWAATDNGISHILLSSPFTAIGENAGISGMGYAAYVTNGKLYLGTSFGLFSKPWEAGNDLVDQTNPFELIAGSEGQVWFIGEADGDLLCGHTRGLFQIIGGKATKISPLDYTGGWTMQMLADRSVLVLGAYEGLEVYKKQGGRWRFQHKIKGFNESSRMLQIDSEGSLWICHGNKGVFKLRLNENADSIISQANISVLQKFPADFFNDITVIDERIVLAGDDGIYYYNDKQQTIERFKAIKFDSDPLVSRIGRNKDCSVWYVNHDNIEVLTPQQDGSFQKNAALFSSLKGQLIGSYEYYWHYDNNNHFIGTQEGFTHFDPSISRPDRPFETRIRNIQIIKATDSISQEEKLLTHILSEEDNQDIPYSNNSLRFSYTALYFESYEKTKYQYYLEREGQQTKVRWSDWATETYKEYTNLHEGSYAFHVRAKNVHDQLSSETIYTFTVLPPWYRTTAAYILYTMFFMLALGGLYKLTKLKISKEKKRLETEKENELKMLERQYAEEALRAEREIILLQNQKLEADVKFQNDELAYLATMVSQKTEFLEKIKKDLLIVTKESDQSIGSIQELIKTIDKENEFDDAWNHFQTNFDRVHHNFLCNLRERFPTLKSTDLLLCAYIRINKSNKEISALLNISVSAVEKRRFRLREKLNLDNDTRLSEFLLHV